MAFLDELKKEAQALQELEQSQTQARMMEVTQRFLLVQMKLKEIVLYLQELVKTLNVVAQTSTRTYYVDGFGTVDDYHPERYAVNMERMTIDQKEFINTIFLRYVCKTGKQIEIEKLSPSNVDLQREYLWKANLKFQCTEFKNEKGYVSRAIFHVVNEIPVMLRFTADFEKARIFLHMKNLNGLTINEFSYDPDEINEAMLDELAKLLVAKPNKFMELGRHQQALKQKAVTKREASEPKYTELDPATKAKLEEAAARTGSAGKKGLFDSIKSLLSKG